MASEGLVLEWKIWSYFAVYVMNFTIVGITCFAHLYYSGPSKPYLCGKGYQKYAKQAWAFTWRTRKARGRSWILSNTVMYVTCQWCKVGPCLHLLPQHAQVSHIVSILHAHWQIQILHWSRHANSFYECRSWVSWISLSNSYLLVI